VYGRSNDIYFNGDIDDVMIFDSELSSEEIKAMYNRGFSLGWDDNGNMTANDMINGTDTTLQYNWDNKLRSATKGTKSISIRYDPGGNRIWKQSIDGAAETTHKYIVDIVGGLPTTLMEMKDVNDTIIKTYVYANGQPLCQHDGDYSAPRYFYKHDRLGSVRQIIDTSGNVKNHYIYEPFGELLDSETQETIGNPFKFTGQYFDSEIDQYYLRARQYDPHIYRFTSRDPVSGKFESPLTFHKYLYCENEPINRIDPMGLVYEWGNYRYYAFNQQETQAVINEALDLVGSSFVLGPWRAFGAGGPHRHGMYDYKDTGNTFKISDLYVMKGSEFTNWLTGYSCFYNYGYWGELGARTGGHVYALSAYKRGESDSPMDELASRYFLGGGILMAQEARWKEGRAAHFMKYWTIFNAKWDLNVGGIERLTSTDFTTTEFDVELDIFLTFWNSGAPL